MLSFKEVLILIFILIGGLAIFLYNYNQPTIQIPEYLTSEPPSHPSIKLNQKGIWVSETKLSTQIKQPLPTESQEKVFPLAKDESKQLRETTAETLLPETGLFTGEGTGLSLENILAEAENLSSELKLEFENIQSQGESCPGCGPSAGPSPSICTTILAQLGGGVCNCATLHCTPHHGPWCVHPCCCVCCLVCCR